MEEERFISGYCRRIDASRSICAELCNGKLESVDCDYECCPHKSNCPIAAELDQMQ